MEKALIFGTDTIVTAWDLVVKTSVLGNSCVLTSVNVERIHFSHKIRRTSGENSLKKVIIHRHG